MSNLASNAWHSHFIERMIAGRSRRHSDRLSQPIDDDVPATSVRGPSAPNRSSTEVIAHDRETHVAKETGNNRQTGQGGSRFCVLSDAIDPMNEQPSGSGADSGQNNMSKGSSDTIPSQIKVQPSSVHVGRRQNVHPNNPPSITVSSLDLATDISPLISQCANE